MTVAEAFLDAFINANILICVAFVFWRIVQMAMQKFGLHYAYRTQLQLLNYVFAAILLAPLIAVSFGILQSNGVASDLNINLSDFVVAYYLNGGFDMKASSFEGLIQSRDTFILNVLSGVGFIAKAVIFAFVAGLIVGAVRLVYSVFCLRRIVKQSYTWRKLGRVHILLSDRTLVPFSTRSLRKYFVVIPTHMLTSQADLKVSLAHEFQHIRQGDLEWEVLLEALKPIFFLNPAFHAWKRRVETLRELNCDTAVLSKGRIETRAYCDTLLSVCQKTLRRDRSFVLAVPKVTLVTADRSTFLPNRPSFLESRIQSLLRAKKPTHDRLLFAAIVLPMLAGIVFTSIAIQRPGDWSQDRLMLSTVVNLDRLDEINRLSTFGRIRN